MEPFGDPRADYRNALLIASLANQRRGKRQRAYRPEQFMPKFGRPRPKSGDELFKKAEFITRLMGGRVIKLGEEG